MENLTIDKKNWTKISLGDVVSEPKEKTRDIIGDGLEHIVGLEHIESGDIHLRNSFSNDTKTTFTKVFRKGDVLFGRRRAYLKKAAQANFDGVCSGDITVLRAKEGLDENLLPFLIHNDIFFDYAVKHSAGGLSPRVKFKDLANYEFLLPPKDQQAQLAELLWALDEVIERDLEVLQKNENHFLSKCKFYFEEDSTDREEVKLGELAEISGGSTPLTTKPEFWDGNIPWLTPSDITNIEEIYFGNSGRYITEKGLESISNRIYPQGSILYCSRASIGEAIINTVPMCTNQGFTNFIPNERVNNLYLYFYLKQLKHLFLRHATGTTFLEVSKQSFRSIKIKIHNIDKQHEISEELLSLYDLGRLINSKIASSKALQRSLINQIF